MARESNAPKEPLTPRKLNDPAQTSVSHHSEFGRPSPIGPTQYRPQQSSQSNHLFNIPKPNQSRPEHHRGVPRPQTQQTGQQYGATHSQRPPGVPSATAPAPAKRGPFDPFQPVRPSEYNGYRPTQPPGYPPGATPIKRPENVTWTTPRAPRPLFSSKPAAPKPSTASKNLQSFIDLTQDDNYASTQRAYNAPFGSNNAPGFGSMDMHGYVDSAKANENIKALLEGAFEDDEDKPTKAKGKRKSKRKGRSKTKQSSNGSPATVVQSQKKDDSGDLDDLAARLEGVNVNDKTSAESELARTSEPDTIKGADAEKDDQDDEAEADEDDADEDDGDDENEDDGGTVEGLKVTLLPHQIDGVKWMCDKETGRRTTKGILPKGGILADDMGLGKTVQAIALMLTNRKSENDEHSTKGKDDGETARPTHRISKTTLVVAPLALIKQWEAEILDKVDKTHKLRVCLYHGANRAKTASSLDTYDVVITTYGTLTSESGTASSDKSKNSGLFSIHWYRIILDEAHTIKNRNAKATQAAYALDSKYRWCLTGTPMQNNLDELQSLIKFLRIKPFDELAAWRDQISRPLANGRGGLAIQRLQVYLKAFMKRRTKDVLKTNQDDKPGEEGSEGKQEKTSNGFHIVKREVIKVDAEFMDGEMNFYKRLEQRTENSLEKMMGGKLDYAGALVLLLRLRQSCNHPDLVKSDLAVDKDVLLQNGNSNKQSKETKQDDLDNVADLFGALSVVTKKCDVCRTDLSQEESKNGASRCGDCEKDLNTDFMAKEKKHKPKEAHKHHKSSVSQEQTARSRKNRRVILDSDDEDEAEWIVPEDQRTMPTVDKTGGSDDENAEGGGEWIGSEDSETDAEVDSPSSKKTRPIVLDDSGDESEDGEDIYQDTEEGENGELPSTKIRHLMKILQRESPDYKFIVFSVFTSMLDKIEPFLKRANVGFARYDGGMRNDHREASLNKLRNNSGTRVLLCSLRAGALGLNLTAASRVVILEPFWNPVCQLSLAN